jgi:hypothetical protein
VVNCTAALCGLADTTVAADHEAHPYLRSLRHDVFNFFFAFRLLLPALSSGSNNLPIVTKNSRRHFFLHLVQMTGY